MRDIKGRFVKDVTLEDIKEGRVAIHTPAQEVFDLVEGLHEDRRLVDPDGWKNYKEKTVIRLQCGIISIKSENPYLCPIIPFSEVEHLFVKRPNFIKALKDKKEIKVKVTPELSKELQQIAFENGFSWGIAGKQVHLVDREALYFANKYITKTDLADEYFENHRYLEYLPSTDTFKDNEEPKIEKSLPEPVKFDDLVSMCKTESYIYSIGKDFIDRLYMMDYTHAGMDNKRNVVLLGVNDLVAEADCYRTLDEAVKVAKSKGWE